MNETTGRYQLIRKLAEGGMAEVFLAKATGPMGFEKTLVVKRILPRHSQNPEFVQMFLNEAKLAAQLNHSNIVQIFDFGALDGTYFIAMEYVDGVNLGTLARRARSLAAPIPLHMCARIIALACDGLAYAHNLQDPATGQKLNLVHRDISSDNIILSRAGLLKLLDFGIAKAMGGPTLTAPGVLKGKFGYMAPEMFRQHSVDARADIYGLGVVLYELVTGRKPIEATGDLNLIRAILHGPIVPIQQRRDDVPPELQRIIEKALMKNRDDRYQSCRELQADLERFISNSERRVLSQDLAELVARLAPPTPPVLLAPTEPAAHPAKPPPAPDAHPAKPPPVPPEEPFLQDKTEVVRGLPFADEGVTDTIAAPTDKRVTPIRSEGVTDTTPAPTDKRVRPIRSEEVTDTTPAPTDKRVRPIRPEVVTETTAAPTDKQVRPIRSEVVADTAAPTDKRARPVRSAERVRATAPELARAIIQKGTRLPLAGVLAVLALLISGSLWSYLSADDESEAPVGQPQPVAPAGARPARGTGDATPPASSEASRGDGQTSVAVAASGLASLDRGTTVAKSEGVTRASDIALGKVSKSSRIARGNPRKSPVRPEPAHVKNTHVVDDGLLLPR